MDIEAARINHPFSDGRVLYVVADTGTTIWDLALRTSVDDFPQFGPHFHDRERGALIAISPNAITELPLKVEDKTSPFSDRRN
jgi:hypothetical protein